MSSVAEETAMEDPLETIKRFVSGDMEPQDFRDAVYSDDRFEALLSEDPNVDSTNYVMQDGGTYYFVIAQDYSDPGGVLNAHGALCDFMDRNGIAYEKSNKYSDFYNLVLDASPNWLDADSKFVAEHIMPEAGGRTGDDLRKWLSEKLLERFRCVDKPPEWIQSPCWPIGNDGPMVFLGQMDVNNYFHDLATAYVFHDPSTGECKTIIQVY
jgi:hypothetical protein